MDFGVQLYGARKLESSDPEAFFQGLSRIGYKYIEPCVCFGNAAAGELWTADEYFQKEPLWHSYGLSARSCHGIVEELSTAAPEIVAFVKKAKLPQWVLGCPSTLDNASAKDLVRGYQALAAELSALGTKLCLHNDAKASLGRFQGKSCYEWMLEACGDAVSAQPDVGWLLYGGIDPETFLWSHVQQICSLHYKDIASPAGSEEDVPLGKGIVDGLACYQFARAAGIPQIVDQDVDRGCLLDDLGDSLTVLQSFAQQRENTESVLCVYSVDTACTEEIARFDHIIEAPNWIPGSESLLYNADGRLYRYDMDTARTALIDTGRCDRCNNDHVISPDGNRVALSHTPDGGWQSEIYISPLAGGEPVRITKNTPSFLHGWSPDGAELAYCAFREHDGETKVDVYSIPAAGGEEKRLTFGEGFNDGPEYSPDGQSLWFNSTRSGLMKIWRMERDGKNPIQMTTGKGNHWFAHLSPDGARVVYLSYQEGQLSPDEHLPNMNVSLRLMDAQGRNDHEILRFFGGQGSINVHSWASDSKRFAFVRYELLHQA
ncbi:MAG: hypothetical protein PHI98_02250 [Eubacteriales bacterium]|nr:hypothetical protein [Eubacteriales bacterium]